MRFYSLPENVFILCSSIRYSLYRIDYTGGNSASIVTFMVIIKLSFKMRPRISEVTMREKFLSDRESNKKSKNINVME